MNARLNATRKLFRRNPTSENRNLLASVVSHALEVKAEVRDEKWMEWCQSLDSHSSLGTMWKKLRSIRNQGPPPPPSHPDPQAEAERLAEKFASRTKSTNLPAETREKLQNLHPRRLLTINAACTEDAPTDTPFTRQELQNALKTGGDTSPGADGITHSMVRHAGSDGHRALLTLFNASLQEGKLPSTWKEATIIPIPKPKEAGAYRPISLLSCVSKTMERMVLHRLQWTTGPLHPAVHAYTKGTGTAECLATLLAATGQGKSTAVFLDLEKAFELADESVILALLAAKGVKGHLLRWIQDYLSDRKASVRFQGKTDCKIITYADDITLICTGPNHRSQSQRCLTLLDVKCRELGLKLNLNKSKAMAFGGAIPDAPLTTGIAQVGWVESHQYLGVWIDRHLTLRKQVETLKDRMLSRTNILKAIASNACGASFRVKRSFPALIETLDKAQNQALRVILSAPRWTKVLNLRMEAQLVAIKHRIPQLSATLIGKMAASARPYIAPGKVFSTLGQDPHLFRHTWARGSAAAVTSCGVADTIRDKGQDSPHPDYTPAPPWSPPLTISSDWLSLPKSSLHPAALKAEALGHLTPLTHTHDTIIYTDGSVDQASGAAGAALVTEGTTLQWRLSSGASSTQAELAAIKGALQHLHTTTAHSALIATDSMAALQALRNPWPQDNVRLLTSIHHLATTLCGRARRITLTWIPGHAGIRGNDLADAAAKAATTIADPEITISPSMAQVKRTIRANTLRLHKTLTKKKPPGAHPLQSGTPEPLIINQQHFHHTHPKVRADVHRLRLGYPCLSALQGQVPLACQHCEARTSHPLLHYLLECPATLCLRTPSHQYPDIEDDDAEEAAALLVAATPANILANVVADAPPP
ncbi:uncharacterized protein LOC123511124 [Portunus trituberculatus]|uniref:uncharacterized protein LOC123511124 n=1 Tax=Portunus trituberculatus TaxID=210409 RepID=UPI001E1CB97C|nr:uncharacterized protein LOC123511124 [Portunus trituberculatus]